MVDNNNVVVYNSNVPHRGVEVNNKESGGQAVNNTRIRDAARIANIPLWRIAHHLGVTDGTLSRKLRQELPKPEQQRILEIIDQLKGGEKA